MVLQGHVTNENHYISTTRLSIRLPNLSYNLDGLLLIKSNGPLVSWYCKITWQTKIIISPISQCLRPPNLGGRVVTYLKRVPPIKLLDHSVTLSCWIIWQTKTIKSPLLKPLNHHQIWQGIDLPWGACFVLVTWYFYHMFFLNQVTNQRHLYYYNTYSHQTYEGGDISWSPTTKITWFFNHVTLISPLAIDQWLLYMVR